MSFRMRYMRYMRYMRLQPGFLLHFFSVPNVRINIRKYRDIPVETPYAPGEHIKGGQQ